MSGLFSQPKIQKAAPPQQPPSLTDPQTRDNASAMLKAPVGFGSTILTSGQGDTSAATIKKQTLGG